MLKGLPWLAVFHTVRVLNRLPIVPGILAAMLAALKMVVEAFSVLSIKSIKFSSLESVWLNWSNRGVDLTSNALVSSDAIISSKLSAAHSMLVNPDMHMKVQAPKEVVADRQEKVGEVIAKFIRLSQI
jgi:hypothetical protein